MRQGTHQCVAVVRAGNRGRDVGDYQSLHVVRFVTVHEDDTETNRKNDEESWLRILVLML